LVTREERKRLEEHLAFLYGREEGAEVAGRIEMLFERYEPRVETARSGWDERDVWLITYGDSIRKEGEPPLRTLSRFLDDHVGDGVTFLHVLPFFPYSSDDGFAVVDYREVSPKLGEWGDIRRLAKRYRLAFDAVFNHVSASSVYMEGFRRGEGVGRDFFIELPPDAAESGLLDRVVRPRPSPLAHRFESARGPKWLWTTFGPDQVDLDFSNPDVLCEIVDVWLFYLSWGASAVRLDAIAYLWKELGTSCIHLPQTHEVVKLLRTITDMIAQAGASGRAGSGGDAPKALILTETNVPHEQNVSYFGDGTDEAQLVYNFPLAPLVLHALHRQDCSTLTEWARGLDRLSRSNAYLSFTASHDGIGMRPTEGVLPDQERAELAALARRHGGDVSYKRDSDGKLSPYELNITFYDALNDPRGDGPVEVEVGRFMVSQAIPLALAGIPAIYIHSLVGSRNDYEGVAETGRARSINRQKLSYDALESELSEPGSRRSRVFSAYMRLLSARRRQPAFHPNADQEVLDVHPKVFALRRHNRETGDTVLALHNVSGDHCRVGGSVAPAGSAWRDLLGDGGGERVDVARGVELVPYGVRWLCKIGDASCA
jgi:sucrose phosphorylase